MEYEGLVIRLSPKLKAISKKVRRRYSYCDEDDFYQEAMLRLWMLFVQHELDDKTDSYILQGCFYFLKNYVRKICKSVDNNSVSLYSAINEEGHTLEDTIVSASFVEQADSIEIYLLLDSVEGRFNTREKAIFYYRLEGFTAREIGERVGVSHVMVVKIEKKIRDKCQSIKKELV